MNRQRLSALSACAAVLLALTLLGLREQQRDDIAGFVSIALAQGAIYLLSLRLVWNGHASRRVLTAILAVAALLRLPVLFAPPQLSTDIYRYVWDGRVEAAGINPYRYIPIDPHLETLRDPEIFPRINRNNYAPTIYPPAAEAIFFVVTRISQSLLAMKAAMVVFEVITVVLLLQLLGAAGRPAQRILVYAWHPLPIWEFAGSGHIDAAMLAFVALALWSHQRDDRWLTGLGLAAAALVKLYPAVLLPTLWRRWDWRVPLMFAAAVVLAYVPVVGVGWRVLGFLPGYATEEGFTGGAGFYLWGLLQTLPAFGHMPALIYIAGAAAILAGFAVAAVFARRATSDDFASAALLAGAFMFLLSPHYPWYFSWLIIFICFAPWLSLLWLTNASFLLYLVPVGSHLVQSDHRLLVETVIYGPFLFLALFDWRRRRPAAWAP